MCAHEMAEVNAAANGDRGIRKGKPCCVTAQTQGLGIVVAIGVAGILFPGLLITANWIAGGKVIVASSVRGPHHTRVREMFSGSPPAPGIFLICRVQ
jgi:hypothetical protein